MATKTQKTKREPKAAQSTAKDFKAAPINAQLSGEEKIELYRTILGIRRFEERSLQAYIKVKLADSYTCT